MNKTEERILAALVNGTVSADQRRRILEIVNNSAPDHQETPHKALLRQSEVAKLLGCHRHTVRNLVKDGKLPVVRLRSLVRYPLDSVLAIARGEVD